MYRYLVTVLSFLALLGGSAAAAPHHPLSQIYPMDVDLNLSGQDINELGDLQPNDGTINVHGSINMSGNEIVEYVTDARSGAPSSPAAGQMWFDTSQNLLKYYNGTQWVVTASADTVASQDLSSVLDAGNSAGSYDINMSTNDILQVRDIYGNNNQMISFFGASATTNFRVGDGSGNMISSLTLRQGGNVIVQNGMLDVRGGNINMNGNNITNADSVKTDQVCTAGDQNCKITSAYRTFKVGGDTQKVYPVFFYKSSGGGPMGQKFVLGRPNVHDDEDSDVSGWYNSFYGVYEFGTKDYGNRAPFVNYRIFGNRGNYNVNGGYETQCATNFLVLYLRGDTTYYFKNIRGMSWPPEPDIDNRTVDGSCETKTYTWKDASNVNWLYGTKISGNGGITLEDNVAVTGTLNMQKNNIKAAGPFEDCWDILKSGASNGNGFYTIDPDGYGGVGSFQVYCDMTSDGGGWTLMTMNSGQPPDNLFQATSGTRDPSNGDVQTDLTLAGGDWYEHIRWGPATAHSTDWSDVPSSDSVYNEQSSGTTAWFECAGTGCTTGAFSPEMDFKCSWNGGYRHLDWTSREYNSGWDGNDWEIPDHDGDSNSWAGVLPGIRFSDGDVLSDTQNLRGLECNSDDSRTSRLQLWVR